MREIEITLGGRQFQVPQRTVGAEASWRAHVQPLMAPLGELAMAAGVATPTPERLARLAFTSNLLLDTQAALDALIAYSFVLADQRGWIEEHAYSDEVVQALFALFFGMMPGRRAQAATNGAPTATT